MKIIHILDAARTIHSVMQPENDPKVGWDAVFIDDAGVHWILRLRQATETEEEERIWNELS